MTTSICDEKNVNQRFPGSFLICLSDNYSLRPVSETTKIPGVVLFLLGLAAFEGGIVLTAVALHWLLDGRAAFAPWAAVAVVAGMLLTFAGPRFLLRAGDEQPRITWGQAGAALPDFALAGWFVLGWAAPQVIGAQAAEMLINVMVLEFILIHASVMVVALPAQIAPDAAWWKGRVAATAGLLLLYSLFAAGISVAYSSLWPFLGFWILFANKYVSGWLRPAAQAKERMREHMTRWGTSAGFYFVLVFGSIFIPVPRLGATSAAGGDGSWTQNPEQALAMGAMYFAALGFCELYGSFRRSVPPAAEF